MTREEAIAFGEAKKWEPMTLRERAVFQMQEERLCMPFSVFHEAVEKTLGRPVYTHEFAGNRDRILRELLEGAPPPSLTEIVEMFPAEKKVLVIKPSKPPTQ
jgi:hypothetical protein